MSEKLFADVIIDISHEKVDKTFEYIVPRELRDKLSVGDCVSVPFGRGNKERSAYIAALKDHSVFPEEELKEIRDKASGNTGATADAVCLALWIRDTYGGTMINALKTVLPAKKVVKGLTKKRIVRKLSREETAALYSECVRKKQTAKSRVLKELTDTEVLPYELITGRLNVSASTLNALLRDGVISIESTGIYRDPVGELSYEDEKNTLSDEQEHIVNEVLSDRKKGINGRYLIHGITGAGKTEVYIKLIEETVKEGKQCIMLIPEIALTYQTLKRFYKRFGDRVSVLNSSLSSGEKYDQIRRAEEGDIDVIIGPRSALFTPFLNLGMVVIDEEHDQSYISDKNPRYHTRETAQKLCEIKGAALVLGSATPSLESYYLAEKGYYKLFKLTRRLTGNTLPRVHIVDMREELKSGNRSVFSRELQDAVKDRLIKGEQIMLFLNRRGYSGFISCRACGHVVKCPHCEVSLFKHRGGKLKCHYCGYETKDISVCPECGSKYISGFKVGTQQIEEAVGKLFPGARTLRMDADTTRTKQSYENILSSFAEGDADVLIGTQMIVKGHDFPNVTLVGVIAADISLNESDFRTGERTFCLLTQAAGRAGRGEKEGLSIIQTYRPEHYSIVRAATQDYEEFYKEELSYRELCDYPPAGVMLEILITSKEEKRALGLAVALKKRVPDKITVIGPAPSVVSKINDSYRYELYLKTRNESDLNAARDILSAFLDTAPLDGETVSFIRL